MRTPKLKLESFFLFCSFFLFVLRWTMGIHILSANFQRWSILKLADFETNRGHKRADFLARARPNGFRTRLNPKWIEKKFRTIIGGCYSGGIGSVCGTNCTKCQKFPKIISLLFLSILYLWILCQKRIFTK